VIVAMIPARGGSKRIPRKNIRPFLGKPIIAYSIEAAINSGLFDKVIVSTDDQEIAAVAIKYGAEVPFIRPLPLSDDHCVLADVVSHTLDFYKNQQQPIDKLCCIYATVPLIDVDAMKQGLALIDQGASGAMAITTFAFPIQRALVVDKCNAVSMLNPEQALTRSQDLPETYHDAAQFFWLNQAPKAGEEGNKAVLVSRYRVQDIDTEEDWLMAENMYSAFHAQQGNEHE
jgi:pseudaminic acid cytidylyltransferase